MMKVWNTPAGSYSKLYADMLTQSHVLLAGATGSGKSTVINGMIHAALFNAPCTVAFVLIDPKKCELIKYADLPHTLKYASEPRAMLDALKYSLQIVDARFKEMQRQRMTEYTGGDVYVIVDELADLMTTASIKREAAQVLQRIAQIGRAAHVHLIAATQCPIAAVIPTPIKCNFDCRMALRTASAQDSRNIIGVKGAENLPDPRREGRAHGYYRRGADLELYNLPRVDSAEIDRLIHHWKVNKPRRQFGLFGRRSA